MESQWKTLIQLMGIIVLIVGGMQQNFVAIVGGMAVLIFNTAQDIDQIKRKVEKMEERLDFEKRLSDIESKLRKISRKGEMSNTTIWILVILILVFTWLYQQGVLN